MQTASPSLLVLRVSSESSRQPQQEEARCRWARCPHPASPSFVFLLPSHSRFSFLLILACRSWKRTWIGCVFSGLPQQLPSPFPTWWSCGRSATPPGTPPRRDLSPARLRPVCSSPLFISLAVRGLRANSTYEFRVWAETIHGRSEVSEVSDVVQLRPRIRSTVLRGVPARMAAPEYQSVEGDRVSICWLPASSTLPVLVRLPFHLRVSRVTMSNSETTNRTQAGTK